MEGHKSDKEERTFLHRGSSAPNFKRQFTLADHVEVRGARFENGLLVIDLQREIPEAKKPRRIAIGGASPRNVTRSNPKPPDAHSGQNRIAGRAGSSCAALLPTRL